MDTKELLSTEKQTIPQTSGMLLLSDSSCSLYSSYWEGLPVWYNSMDGLHGHLSEPCASFLPSKPEEQTGISLYFRIKK